MVYARDSVVDDRTIPTARGELPVAVHTPSGVGPFPAVVLIHDAIGMSNDLRHQARWLADQGYLTAAPNLFHGRNTRICLMSVMRELRSGHGRSFDDLEAVRLWLRERVDCTGAVGVLGCCLGGGFSLLLAASGRFDAASTNYGTAPLYAHTPEFLARSCPIVASYGAHDVSLRGTADRLARALEIAGVQHDVKEYPEAGHGFLNDHESAGDETPPLFAVYGRLSPDAGYHDPSARDARRRIVAFFDAHLRRPASTQRPLGRDPQNSSRTSRSS